MASRHGETIAAIVSDINQQLTAKLGMGEPFQDEPQCPGQVFGLVDPQAWRNDPNPFLPIVELPCNLWVTAAYSSYTAATAGGLQLMADLDSAIGGLGLTLDRRGILMELVPPPDLSKGLRALSTMPNTGTNHLWIVDITGSIVLKLAIDKNVCGHV
jgi:hypothetical protein